MKVEFGKKNKKSIFRAIFVPVIILMICQSIIFYVVAVYGGVESSLNQNAADILSERLISRKNEFENKFNVNWTDFSITEEYLNDLYSKYKEDKGEMPFVANAKNQLGFLEESTDSLIKMLRMNNVNGVFLILNDKESREINPFSSDSSVQKYGICIRDMEQTSAYNEREDLLLERCPSSLVEKTGCALDSWWESRYIFTDEANSSYYYEPLNAAWNNPGAKGEDIAYFCDTHSYSKTSQDIISYSIPLIDENNYPYAVLGVELTTKYISSQLPSSEIGNIDDSCYILATTEDDITFTPITSNGVFFNRCFSNNDLVSKEKEEPTGGFSLIGRGNTKIYGDVEEIKIYNSNNPFEGKRLVLLGLAEYQKLFTNSNSIKLTLLWVSVLSLFLGAIGTFAVTKTFARPIKALASCADNIENMDNVQELGYVGISEIDRLVDSIEVLNKNVSKEIARTEFFSRMSHDMRTPMNAIISFSSDELLENTTAEQKEDYLKKIHTSGIYLLGLINEVLDMTKIESNKVDIHNEAVFVDDLWDTVVPMVEELAKNKDIGFVQSIRKSPELCVCADKQHINQIVLNLLSNAVKFTPEKGKVYLDVSFNKDRQNSNKVLCCICVRDTGIGMSEEFISKLYTPFEQESSKYGGTGLGLSITKKLVELMGGVISCNSKKNVGTTFNVVIPLEISNTPARSQKEIQEKADDSVLSGKHLLVCEDHPLNILIAKRLLERKNMIVDTAENGKIGVEIFSSSKPNTYDAVLMDIRMPEMDGLKTTVAIRSLDREDAKTIPIIAMTANAFDEDVRESRAAGMNAHLSKPIEPEKLYSTLTTILK